MKMTTASGRYIDLTNIPEAFSEATISKEDLIEEISRGLSNTLRFAGQFGPLTVAQHSRLVARLAGRRRQSRRQVLLNLTHDASEAYLGDIPTPLKNLLPDYRALEAQVQCACYCRLAGSGPSQEEKKLLDAADKTAFEMEVTMFSPFLFPCYGMEKAVRIPEELRDENHWLGRTLSYEAYHASLTAYVL